MTALRPSLALSCLIAAPLLAAATPSSAQTAPKATSVRTEYGVSMLGLPVGRASFDTSIKGQRFSIDGTLASAGLGTLVAKTSGTSKVSGRLGRDRMMPERYALNYSTGSRAWSSDVAFRGAAAVSSKVSPVRPPKPDHVPVTRKQLASAIDPLSGLMIRTGKAASVCNRTLPFYDGWSRLDLKLSPAGQKSYSMTGYSGDAQVCDVRIQPVGGYDKSSKGLRYLQGQTIQMWFAPIAAVDIFVPVYARIPTKIGPLTLSATSVSTK
ncbi:DUF3108 domain-containing protein [Mangrovicella endophytica]|uniref:DUF3108 domain-containing protein n=1 Tax=Mangrovicella endophytica TaxID=2066697 RepID=UPI001FE135EF|nr:DUF3108 domain-containing protein [Mangrovicella endophytica]